MFGHDMPTPDQALAPAAERDATPCFSWKQSASLPNCSSLPRCISGYLTLLQNNRKWRQDRAGQDRTCRNPQTALRVGRPAWEQGRPGKLAHCFVGWTFPRCEIELLATPQSCEKKTGIWVGKRLSGPVAEWELA